MSDLGQPVFRHEGVDGREPGAEHPVDDRDLPPIDVSSDVADLDADQLAILGQQIHAQEVGRLNNAHRRGPNRERHT